jgi:hypothetical protein
MAFVVAKIIVLFLGASLSVYCRFGTLKASLVSVLTRDRLLEVFFRANSYLVYSEYLHCISKET